MASTSPEQPPEVTWAQRSSATDPARNFLYMTINAPDVDESSLKLDIQPTHIDFSGYSKTKKLNYKVKLDFFADIDPTESQSKASARGVDLVLRKKEAKEEFWPRLTKEKVKLHFLRTDFDKWVDEDEQDEKEEGDPYADMMGGGGMPGMPGMGGDMGGMGGMGGGMGGIDFSKLAGMQGMEGLGGAPGAGGDEDDEEDDDDLPDLEDDAKGAEAGKAKIEEVS